ncbi:DUF1801 domain-containing protein [Demequina sediminicola]|uniref:DUF1801 domain-containing protein n=1 Tax=Demequina sediminicola TaxID=1095026 RepID=UPI000781B390|nr:DUF1801 domain-containing protein [Demequina sediminicola]
MTDTPPLPASFDAVIAAYPREVRERLLELRDLVWDVAEGNPSIGPVVETLKWGQPSFLTQSPRTGTTVRIDRIGAGHDVAVFTHCQTTLVDEFRAKHGKQFDCDGTRGVIVPANGSPLEPAREHALRDHIEAALTYHLR